MTPLAIRMWDRAALPSERQALGDMLSGCQFFSCGQLLPFIDLRLSMDDAKMASVELLDSEIPAESTWLDFGATAILLSKKDNMLSSCPGSKIRVIAVNESRTHFSGAIMPDGAVDYVHALEEVPSSELQSQISMSVRAAWFAVEAMQTPGMTHRCPVTPTRQQVRAARRAGKPCHKFVEIRLGRGPKRGGDGHAKTGRTVAWHYRRGHRVEHPNPNYPKWRKGAWVGSTDAGIRTHNYIVEVPD